MINEFKRKFSKDFFKNSHNEIIHFKFDGGKILKENRFSYTVSFSKGIIHILKKKIIVV